MKSENKLEGASNFRAWKLRVDIILAKNKVLDIVTGNIMEPTFAASISSRKETPTSEELWASCAQEESGIILRDRKEEASQALATRFKNKGKKKSGSQHKKSNKKDMSKIQ